MNNTNDTINKLHDYICKSQEIIYNENKHIDEFKYNSEYNAADINEKLRVLNSIKESFLEDIVTRSSGLIGADLMEKAYKYDCNRMRMKAIAMFLILVHAAVNLLSIKIHRFYVLQRFVLLRLFQDLESHQMAE